jgi:hypothetical protein
MAPEEYNDPETDRTNALAHPNPEQLLNPEELRNWLRQSRPLPDGSDYELLIRTTKKLPGGASVVLERLLLRFDVRDGQPFPAADEPLPAPLPQPELIEIPETEGDQPEPGGDQVNVSPVGITPQVRLQPDVVPIATPEVEEDVAAGDSEKQPEPAIPARPAAIALPGTAAVRQPSSAERRQLPVAVSC